MENIDYNVIDYPLQILPIKRIAADTKTTLTVECFIEPARVDQGQSPMEFFTESSCFKLTLIEVDGANKKSPYANITLDVLDEIKENTSYAHLSICAERTKPKSITQQNNNIAFTQKINIGKKYKGKTPGQILLDNPAEKDGLLQTADWLKERIQNHQDNEAQYNAIMEAIQMLNAGKLKDTHQAGLASTPPIAIYSPGFRTQKKKHKKETDKNLIHNISIWCYPADEYPYEITITNFYAECDGIIPKMETKSYESEVKIRLLSREWNHMIGKMNRIVSTHYFLYGKSMVTLAKNSSEQKRAQYSKKKE